jgi:hypothetical protein
VPALTGNSITSSSGSVAVTRTGVLISNTITILQQTIIGRPIYPITTDIGDAGFGANDYGTAPWAGSNMVVSANSGYLAGIMGMF